ncbi:hypothetical protein [Gordonia sp. NPDC003429]
MGAHSGHSSASAHRRKRLGLVVIGVILSLVVSFGGEKGVAGIAAAAPHSGPAPTPGQPRPEPPTPGSTPKECVGSRFATFGAIYDAIFDSLLPVLPQNVRDSSTQIKAAAHRDMDGMRISTLAISNHPYDMGANEKSPIMTYREPISQWIVTQLINVRNGKTADAMTVENLTVAQAVETVYLYLYVTVLVPLTIVRRTIPSIATVAGPITVGTLLTLPILLGVFATNQLFSALSKGLVNACIVSVTKEQKDRAGKPVKDLRFAWAVPGIVRDIANQVSMADPQTCPAIGTLPLSRIVTRTSNYLQAINRNPVTDRQIRQITGQVQQFMKTTRVNQNLIPADPADFNTPEYVISQVGVLIPYVGGAPLDVVIGLNHNKNQGADFAATQPLWDLSVTKTLTAAYYAYALTTHVIELAWENGGTDPAASLLNDLFPGLGITSDMIPHGTGILGAPNLYGLVVYHNVLRSMCLSEDRKPAKPGTAVSTVRW